jgi:hypothetical protein
MARELAKRRSKARGRISFIPDELAPLPIVAARAEIRRRSWQGHATSWLLVAYALLSPVLLLMMLWAMLLLKDASFASCGMWLALSFGAGGAPLLLTEAMRRSWQRRREELEGDLEPYDRRVEDRRWAGAQQLLAELRGPDPDSNRAEGVYALTRALVEEFAAIERLRRAVQASRALSDRGSAEMEELLRERDAELDRTLADLQSACVEVLRGRSPNERATVELLRDLTLRLAAEREATRPPPVARPAGAPRQRVLDG